MAVRSTIARCLAVSALAVTVLASGGCVSGAVFRHTTEPLDVNFDATPVHRGKRGTSHKTLVIPYPVRMQFEWGSTAVGDAMRAKDMTRVYYADIETLSFMGLWTQQWIHIYGD